MVLKDCSRCMVYTPKGQRLSEARVVHAKDSVTLFFSDYQVSGFPVSRPGWILR